MQERLLKVSDIVENQDAWTADWHGQERLEETRDFLKLVEENHWHNFSLWHEEDIARRDDVGFERIYHAKRAIDGHNQKRNNAMEKMDMWLLERMTPSEAAPLNSETPGMMVDRLSILGLKSYHMAEEVAREDASEEHRAKCGQKLEVIQMQRTDLANVLERFLGEIGRGERRFKVYFQFKMYNDPSLNPQLYGKQQGSK